MSDALDPIVYALGDAGATGPSQYKLATVTNITGGISVQFDSESIPSTKKYKRLSAYTAVINHRVLLAKVGSTWVILGTLVD